jgi:hypothetical protein
MNTLSYDMTQILEASLTLGLVFKTNLFRHREPAFPNTCVSLFETSGEEPLTVLNKDSGGLYEKPSMQIRIRHEDAEEGLKLGQDIIEYLHGRNQEVVNGTLYSMIRSLHPPYVLDWDDSNRIRIALNFDIQRRTSN